MVSLTSSQSFASSLNIHLNRTPHHPQPRRVALHPLIMPLKSVSPPLCSSSATAPSGETVEFSTHISPQAASPEEVDYSSQHPWDPHEPAFSPLLPKPIRPYPSFEGWFLRLVDYANRVSVGVIMATNYATAESQVTLLFSLSDQQAAKSRTLAPGRTYSVYARSKDSKFTKSPPAKETDEDVTAHQPKGFEWEAPNIGRIIARPHETFMDVTLQGYSFKSHMVNEVLWDRHDSQKGPEGWARKISIFPTHWYIYSLGSEATYELSNEKEGLHIKGSGLAHQEKNWGETFPAGHVWLQAASPDNKFQLVASGAYFKIGDKLKTPYIFAMGYRSPNLKIDMRTNDPGVIFKDIGIFPLEGKFSVLALGPSHTFKISCTAPPESFSDPLLCPIGKLDWLPACRESYYANVKVEVYEHLAWGVAGNKKLVDSKVFDFAGLEFGEDLLKAAEEQQRDQQKSFLS